MARTGNNLERIKFQNIESIKEIIYRQGPISRAEIAELLQLTPPTITTNVANLIQQGIVRECENVPSQEGRRALGRRRVLIDYIPDAKYTVGVECGYHGMLICLVDIRCNVVAERKYTDRISYYEETIDAVGRHVEELLEEQGIPREKIAGLGIAFPGFVNQREGVLRYGAINKWKDKTITKDLESRTGFACIMENNVRCCAIGEAMRSDRLRPETFAYFLVSRGLGCPMVIRNRLHVGEMTGAGEVGHMVVAPKGPVCPTCGNRGCLEGISSELAIRERCGQAVREGVPTLLNAVCANPAEPQIEEILQAQNSNDHVVCTIMEDAITYIGIGLANIINFISPPLVIIDGRILQSEKNQKLLIEVTRNNLFSVNVEEVDMEFVPFNKFRAAMGAAALAIRKFILEERR